jgi:hypothetical protein
MKISYAITVCNELEEIKHLVSFLLLHKREEDEVIILEDDCQPTEYAYEFFDNQNSRLSSQIVMACGTSPWDGKNDENDTRSLTLSSYPLIWGWSTNLESWSKIGSLIQTRTPHLRVLKAIIQNPSKMGIMCFFCSSVHKGHQ